MENKIPEPLHKIGFHGLKLVKKINITKSVVRFFFEIAPSQIENYRFRAGQYVRIKLVLDQKIRILDFSLLPCDTENELSFAVKMNSENEVHQALNSVQFGSEVEISKPIGHFYLDHKPNEKRSILGFASGIGISPIYAQITELLRLEKDSRFFLFYGNKNPKTIAFKKELDVLQSQNPERFFLYYFYSESPQPDVFFNGRLDAHKVKLIKNQLLEWDEVDRVLICGPNSMIKDIANACWKEGLRQSDILFEHFTNTETSVFLSEFEFEEIKNIDVEFVFNKKHYQAKIASNRRKLLPQMIEQGFEVPYSCKSGVCGICACYLEEGKVHMTDENEYLTDRDLKKNLILPCISYVESGKVKLNFDL